MQAIQHNAAPCATETEALWMRELARNGYLVLRQAMNADHVARLHADLRPRFDATPFCQGEFYGERTKRFGALLKRSPLAQAYVMHDAILRIAALALGPHCDCVQLNLTQALEIHPGEVRQAPHRDEGMYWAPPGAAEYLFNVMWPFTRYTEENGATMIYAGSNQRPNARPEDLPPPTAVELDVGDALIFLGSVLHGAGANRSRAPRTGMIVGYSLGWLKPYENQWLAYPPSIARTFPPDLAALVGYRQHRPNLGNFEGQCPSVLLREGGPPDYLEAIDDVTSEQRHALAAFKRAQTDRAA